MNRNVIARLRVLVRECTATSCGNGAFERGIEFHMEALEAVGLTELHQARSLAHELCQAHFLDGEEEFGDPIDAEEVKERFHLFLDALAECGS